jgi:hypothetical protein
MSVIGTKRTSNCRPAMSVFGGKADIGFRTASVKNNQNAKAWENRDGENEGECSRHCCFEQEGGFLSQATLCGVHDTY